MSRTDEISPLARSGHVAVIVREYILVWGGYSDFALQDQLFAERYLNPETLWVYNTEVRQWYKVETKGDHPPGTSGACAVAAEGALYLIGGHTDEGNTNDLFKLTLHDMTWHWLPIDQAHVSFSPRDKFTAWEHNERLYIFGGFGVPFNNYLHDNGEFHGDPSTYSARGWNNQLLYYRLSEDETRWHNPQCKGCVPSSRAAHASARVRNSVFVFGGRHRENRMNDLHMLDLDSLCWQSISMSGELPVARSWHSLTAISQNRLFVYGGYTQNCEPLSDAWVLDISQPKWTKLKVAANKTRLWHTASYSPDGGVHIYGGCCNNILSPDDPNEHTSELLVFQCTVRTLLSISMDAVLEHSDRLASEWDSLPRSLADRLKFRQNVIKHPSRPVEQAPAGTIGFTCTLS